MSHGIYIYKSGIEPNTYSRVHKYLDSDTILIILLLYTTTVDLKRNNQDVRCVQYANNVF